MSKLKNYIKTELLSWANGDFLSNLKNKTKHNGNKNDLRISALLAYLSLKERMTNFN